MIILENVALELVCSCIVWVHLDNFFTDLETIIVAAFSFLQQRQQDPVLHDILGGFDSDPYMLVSLIQLVHMGVHIADVLVYERDVSILRLYISCQ